MHGGRTGYFVQGEGFIVEPSGPAPGGGADAAAPIKVSSLKFGRMFERSHTVPPPEGKALFDRLIQLGLCMNGPQTFCQRPPVRERGDSEIPAGYTYLGQFIAHEITFDDTGDLLQVGMEPHNLRTPQIDLDSLYGGTSGPADKPELYEADGVHLRVGHTGVVEPPGGPFPYDLPRDKKNPENQRRAVIGDKRNDENLAVAQTHLAFIKFHNRVVEALKDGGHLDDGLFECAREQVVRHFQWIILYDYLPRLVDEGVLDCVLRHGNRWFRADGPKGLFMPLEFSAAAFRIGHSMVRRSYDWNEFHRKGGPFKGAASIGEVFQQTGFSRLDSGFPNSAGTKMITLPSDWIIDWRRFYDFTPLAPGVSALDPGRVNRSSKLDTILGFNLVNDVVGFPDTQLDEMQKAITIRNLLRGYYLGLSTGEEAAEWVGEKPLTYEQVSGGPDGPHRGLLSDPALCGRTPLWYYVLKEAELLGRGKDGTPGHRLGPVGSRIVAETLVELIRNSPHSILQGPGWRPRYGRPARGEEPENLRATDLLRFAFKGPSYTEGGFAPPRFEMIDLLKFAFDGAVNPLG